MEGIAAISPIMRPERRVRRAIWPSARRVARRTALAAESQTAVGVGVEGVSEEGAKGRVVYVSSGVGKLLFLSGSWREVMVKVEGGEGELAIRRSLGGGPDDFMVDDFRLVLEWNMSGEGSDI